MQKALSSLSPIWNRARHSSTANQTVRKRTDQTPAQQTKIQVGHENATTEHKHASNIHSKSNDKAYLFGFRENDEVLENQTQNQKTSRIFTLKTSQLRRSHHQRLFSSYFPVSRELPTKI